MCIIMLVLVCLAFAGQGRRLQVTSRRIQGSSHETREYSGDEFDKSQAEANPHERAIEKLQALAKFLPVFGTPAAAWQAGGHGCKFVVPSHERAISSDTILVSDTLAKKLGLSPPQVPGTKLQSSARLKQLPACVPRSVVPHRSSTPIASAARPGAEVKWIAVDNTLDDAEPREGVMTLPVFVLDLALIPYSRQQRISIFEKRYVDLYNDILYSGARRLAVFREDTETNSLSEVGVVLYLDDLRPTADENEDLTLVELDEEDIEELEDLEDEDIEDEVYLATHSVIGRVKLLRVLNPRANVTTSTYLRAEVEPLEDTNKDEDSSETEQEVLKLLDQIVDMQEKLDEDPRFTEDMSLSEISVRSQKPNINKNLRDPIMPLCEEPGLWDTILLWHEFLELRYDKKYDDAAVEVFEAIQDYFDANDEEASDDFNADELEKFLTFNQDLEMEWEDEVQVGDLPEALVQQVRAIEDRHQEDLEAMDSHPHDLEFHALLQSTSHAERLLQFKNIVDIERKRLATRRMLQALFKKGNR